MNPREFSAPHSYWGEGVDSPIHRNSHNTPTRTYKGVPLSEWHVFERDHEEVRGLRAPAAWGGPPDKREVRNRYVRRDDPEKAETIAALRRGFGQRRAIPAKARFRVLERCGFKCVYCGRPATEVPLVIDHVVPVVAGGSDDEANLAAACRDCNAGKGGTPLEGHEPPAPETTADGYAIARVRLKRGKVCWYWVIDRCPFCAGRHTHGGGPLNGNPRRLLGHRSQHCMEGPEWPRDGYELVESPR